MKMICQSRQAYLLGFNEFEVKAIMCFERDRFIFGIYANKLVGPLFYSDDNGDLFA